MTLAQQFVSPLPRTPYPTISSSPAQSEDPFSRAGESINYSWTEAWDQIAGAELRYQGCHWASSQSVVVFRRNRHNLRCFALTAREREMLYRVLLGHRQKMIAADSNVATSTVANCLRSAMIKLGVRSRLEAAPLASLALSASMAQQDGRYGPRIYSVEPGEFVLARVPAPDWGRLPTITESEREVCILIVQGKSNHEIAARRQTSIGTVQNQVASLFRKMHANGRFDLLNTLYHGE